MTSGQRLLLALYAAIVAAWPIRHLVVTWIVRRFDRLTRRSPVFCLPDPPLVSAIIPAKDEEETIAECLATVRAQTYANIEILVVDDRSIDRTAEIVRAAVAADSRVRLLENDRLPPGWTGKTHALHTAAAEARGEWFWFLDADTRHAPESLAIVLEYARSNRAALASLLPEMRCETFWERITQPLMGIVLMRSFPLALVNRDDSAVAFANGQYILVRRDAYEAAGGHSAVRDRFVEDIALAGRVKALGQPIRTAIGVDIGSTRMYASLPQLVRGWSRILYDAFGRRAAPLVGKIVEPLVFSQSFVVALGAAAILAATGQGGPLAAWLTALAAVHILLQVSVLYRMYALSAPATAWAALWYPLAGIVSDWILIKSIGMCLTGRVTWRGTVYGPAPRITVPAEEASRA
jgi:hypothetical protein